jgi:DNA-directed RNA polymerase specialized sigma24 family protein
MSSSGYVIPVDPAQIASRFSANEADKEDQVEQNEAEEPLITRDNFETQIAPLLDRIPEREADLIYLYYIERKRQADIAQIFNVTQAAISYRLDRGIQRIRFLLSIPKITEDDIRRDLPEVFKPIDVDILVGMWETTCQSEVANRLGLTQGRVRHRFFRAVKTLEGAAAKDEKFKPYYEVFKKISNKGFNILREVRLPQWANRGGDAVG